MLYGTTTAGGGGNCTAYWSNGAVVGCGTIFELTPPVVSGGAWTENILYSFTGGNDGGYPGTLVLAPSGILYGTALSGGANGAGVVFELVPPKTKGGAWKEYVLHNFCS